MMMNNRNAPKAAGTTPIYSLGRSASAHSQQVDTPPQSPFVDEDFCSKVTNDATSAAPSIVSGDEEAAGGEDLGPERKRHRRDTVFETKAVQNFPQASGYLEKQEIFVVTKNTDREGLNVDRRTASCAHATDQRLLSSVQTEPLCLTTKDAPLGPSPSYAPAYAPFGGECDEDTPINMVVPKRTAVAAGTATSVREDDHAFVGLSAAHREERSSIETESRAQRTDSPRANFGQDTFGSDFGIDSNRKQVRENRNHDLAAPLHQNKSSLAGAVTQIPEQDGVVAAAAGAHVVPAAAVAEPNHGRRILSPKRKIPTAKQLPSFPLPRSPAGSDTDARTQPLATQNDSLGSVIGRAPASPLSPNSATTANSSSATTMSRPAVIIASNNDAATHNATQAAPQNAIMINHGTTATLYLDNVKVVPANGATATAVILMGTGAAGFTVQPKAGPTAAVAKAGSAGLQPQQPALYKVTKTRNPNNDNRERAFACDYKDCGKTYLKSSHLKAHYRNHTGEISLRAFRHSKSEF